MKSFVRALLSALVIFALGTPAIADDRGHGAISFSPSGHRIGWAKSLGSDDAAKQVALTACEGGTSLGPDMMQHFHDNTAGVNPTAASYLMLQNRASDCRFIQKFDSSSNHACEGFGYDDAGRFTQNGARDRDYAAVQRDLSGWAHTFIICNDDKSVQGGILGFLDRLATALSTPTPAPYIAPPPTASPYTPNPSFGANRLPPTSIRIVNTVGQLVRFSLQCKNSADEHAETLDTNVAQTFRANDWQQNCAQFRLVAANTDADGVTSETNRTLAGGTVYELYYDSARAALDVRARRTEMTVRNTYGAAVVYRVSCPKMSETVITIAPGETNTSGLPCPAGTIAISTGTDDNHVDRSYPVVDGRAYRIQFDTATQLIVLVPAPAM